MNGRINRSVRGWSVFAAVVWCCVSPLSAMFTGTSGLPGDFLRNGVTARSYAVGRSQVAYPDDLSALYLNPAGLVLDGRLDVSAMNITPFEDFGTGNWYATQYNFIGVRVPMATAGTFALGAARQSVGDVDIVDEGFNVMYDGAKAGASAMAVFLSYAKRLFIFPYRLSSFGVSVKAVNQQFTYPGEVEFNTNSWGVGLDLGVLQQMTEWLYLGLQAEHILPPVLQVYDPQTYPTIVRAGLAVKPNGLGRDFWGGLFRDSLLTCSFNTIVHYAYYYNDGAGGAITTFSFQAGVEKQFVPVPRALEFSVRAGLHDMIFYNDGRGLDAEASYGIGLRLLRTIQLDVSSDSGVFGPLNRTVIGVSLLLDVREETAEEFSRLADESQARHDSLLAKTYLKRLAELRPRSTRVYKRMRFLDQRLLKEYRKTVTYLCRQDDYQTAVRYIQSRRHLMCYRSLVKTYVDEAIKDVRRYEQQENAARRDLRLRWHLRRFPHNHRLSQLRERYRRE